MKLTIREARQDDLDAVVRCAESAGLTVDRAQLSHRLTLLASASADGNGPGAVLGVVLCVETERHGVVLDIALSPDHADVDLARQLVGKAIAKTAAVGVRACRVHVHGPIAASENDPLSTGSNWYDRYVEYHAA